MNTNLSVLCKLVVTIYFLSFRVVITLIIKRESTQLFQLVSTYLNMLNTIVCFVLDIVVINVNYDWYGHFHRYWYTDNIMNFRNTYFGSSMLRTFFIYFTFLKRMSLLSRFGTARFAYFISKANEKICVISNETTLYQRPNSIEVNIVRP